MNLLETIQSGFAELKATLSSKVSLDAELTQARAENAALTLQLKAATDATASLKELNDSHAATVNAKDIEIDGLKASVSAKDAEIAKLNSEAKSLGERAVALVAGQGIASKDLPASLSASSGSTRDELMAEFAKLTDPKARASFYATHSKTLLGN